ncbi:universal stress protein [Variovorax sp. PAMC26660]|uniref:universal stress protein n=1 Tax=Variovorax sp. PAMC26660 TaxID=2762322 RepID=UPI00164D75CD|nr:universal stress protein [Variovorax sp. PAMC26660]QNK65938.1 universal stress protein [Variovorax sp. PAMC26660]
MHIQSILAITDLSARGHRTVRRAAAIAAEHGALLKLMYAPTAFTGATETGAHATRHLAGLAVEMAEDFGILVKKVDDTSGHLEAIAQEARWSDLLVVGDVRAPCTLALFHGQPVERLLRAARKPVLVARLDAATRYRRILVAVDLTDESRHLVELAWAFDSAAEVELFHALNTMHEGKLRYADVSDYAIKSLRHACARHARERMLSLSDSSTARRNRVVSAIGQGDPARQAAVQQQYSKAELLVVGKHGRSAIIDFVFGSVAQRVLKWSASDVLVVPRGSGMASPVKAEPVAHGVLTPVLKQ